MVREAREEIGVELDSADLELVHVMHRKQREPMPFGCQYAILRKYAISPKSFEKQNPKP